MWKGESSLVIALTYHSISDGPGPLCISVRRFEQQLELLLEAGFQALQLGTVVAAVERRQSPGGRFFCLTFDDAYRDFRDAALPVLRRLSLPVTLFATAAANRDRLPGGTGQSLLGLNELRELTEEGVEIGAHSMAHVDLTTLDDSAVERELLGSRQVLENHTDAPVQAFAYPFGRHDARVRRIAGRVFRSAWTTRLAAIGSADDPRALPRLDAHYLRSPVLRRLLAKGRPEAYLTFRGWLRRLRGTETRGR